MVLCDKWVVAPMYAGHLIVRQTMLLHTLNLVLA